VSKLRDVCHGRVLNDVSSGNYVVEMIGNGAGQCLRWIHVGYILDEGHHIYYILTV
jgi:hypothetical protein